MNRSRERGQILPIAAVAIVVLIGIGGLVMDVGMTWILLRREQAVVDVASIAAARHIPDGDVGAMEEAACFYARENGFFASATTYDLSPSGCVPANDGFAATLTVNFPPANGPYAGQVGFVEVLLDGSHATFFSKVFGINSMPVTTNAVSGNIETTGGGGQLVALDPTSCGAGQVRGNGVIEVEGSVYVNSDGSGPPPCPGPLDDQCQGANGAFAFGGVNSILHTPQLSIRGTCGRNANDYPNYASPDECPTPCGLTEGAPQIEDPFSLVTPTRSWAGVPTLGLREKPGPLDLTLCDEGADTGCTFNTGSCGDWCEIHPGVYYGGWQITKMVCLHPGFYYIAGGGIQVSGADGRLVTLDTGETCAGVMDGTNPGGDGRILLYSTDGPDCPTIPVAGDRHCQGTISIAGQGGFQARGYQETLTVVRDGITDEEYHRLLVWQAQYKEDGSTRTSRTYPGDTDYSNDIVSIVGQGNLDFWGTVYAPKSRVQVQGSGSGAGDVAGVQILAWQFDIAGNGALSMPFDPAELSTVLAKGLVY